MALMRAKPGKREAARRALLACVAPSRAEPGNLGYDVHVDLDDALRFVVVERWASAGARERHLQSGHFAQLIAEVDESDRLTAHTFHALRAL